MTDDNKTGPRLWPKRLGALAASSVVACLLAEMLVTVFLGEQVKFPRHVVGARWGLRMNEPGAEYRHKSPDLEVWFRINGQGMRADRDYRYEKPEGTLRIVSLGDSYTIGYEVELDECFSSVLERELRARGYAVEVINGGVSGFGNAEELLYLERELMKYNPDLVLISYYHNDPRDNVRSNLFRLQGDELVPAATEYVPMGWLANFLNTNGLFSFLSGYSNAFAFVKERTTLALKESLANRAVAEAATESAPPPPGQQNPIDESPAARSEYPPRLSAAILSRSAKLLDEKDIPLVIHTRPRRGRHRAAGGQLSKPLLPGGPFRSGHGQHHADPRGGLSAALPRGGAALLAPLPSALDAL